MVQPMWLGMITHVIRFNPSHVTMYGVTYVVKHNLAHLTRHNLAHMVKHDLTCKVMTQFNDKTSPNLRVMLSLAYEARLAALCNQR